MSYKVIVNPGAKRVCVWLFDIVTDNDFTEFIAAIRESSTFEPHFDMLMDFSHATLFTASSSSVARAGHASDALFATTAMRTIFTPNDLGYGIARMFQLYAEKITGETVQVFRTKAEACTLLKAENLSVPPLVLPHVISSGESRASFHR